MPLDIVFDPAIVTVDEGVLRALTTAWHNEGPKKPKSFLENIIIHISLLKCIPTNAYLYSSAKSGGQRICFKIGGQTFCNIARMCPAAVLSVLLCEDPNK